MGKYSLRKFEARLLFFWIFVLLLSCSSCGKNKSTIDPEIPTESNDIPMIIRNSGYNNISFEWENDSWLITTEGLDPYFWLDANKAVDFNSEYMLSFDYQNQSEELPLVIFVGNACDNDHLLENGDYYLPISKEWKSISYDLSQVKKTPSKPFTSVRIRFGLVGNHQFRVRNFVIRKPNEAEKEAMQEKREKEKEENDMSLRLNSYLSKNFSSKIVSVIADYQSGTISIKGNIGTNDLENVGLAEIPMWVDQTKISSVGSFESLNDTSFSKTYSRYAEDGHDRLLSGWAIVKEENSEYTLLSAMHNVDKIENPRSNLPPKIPNSIKGIGGCPFDHEDMTTLGVTNATFNIILDQILTTTPTAGCETYEYAGKTYYADINGSAIKQIDHDVKEAQRHDLMVSAILLIPVNRGSSGSWLSLVAHPETEKSAAYSMPNMLSKEAVEAYAATMNFLCERYSTEERGRIHHWIIHNEIQSGYYWTNAGQRTLETYMNLYERSMRLVQTIARQYDSNAKALISLDHDWTIVSSDRSYSGLSLLNQLLKYCHQEGDFEWGLAFHPYPEDINNPKTWLDQDATYSFSTKYITPKNLEVLDEWVAKPEVSYNGVTPREIQLTEQGINSPDYGSESLTNQAAGVAYSLAKIQMLNNVTTYAYHLWADAHEEGTLRLGLRKYSDDSTDPYGKKPSWDVFRAFGTEEWNDSTKAYRSLLGITDWSEVHYTGSIN